jgi:universal stress protein E
LDGRIRTIVVGVATTEGDARNPARGDEEPVLGPAIALAQRLGATLHVVHVFELPQPILTAYATHALYVDPDIETRYAAQMRDHLLSQLARYPGAERFHCHAVEGSPARRLAEFAALVEADLIMVGVNRRGDVWRHFLGSTAERVLRHAPVPVLVVRRPFEEPVRRVLLTTDLSAFGAGVHRGALRAVNALFGSPALELRALLVVSFDAMLPPPVRTDLLSGAATEALDDFIEGHTPRETRIEGKVRMGEPVREILHEASEWHADLLVLGTHGRSGVGRLLLGSTASAVLRDSSGNVLVIPAGRAAERFAELHAGERSQMPDALI